jgi:hypothetical protein
MMDLEKHMSTCSLAVKDSGSKWCQWHSFPTGSHSHHIGITDGRNLRKLFYYCNFFMYLGAHTTVVLKGLKMLFKFKCAKTDTGNNKHIFSFARV